MKGKFKVTMYIIFTILLLAALSLLFLRQPFADYFRHVKGIDQIEILARKPRAKEFLINKEIVESDKMKSLSQQVTVFSVEDICGASVNSPRQCSVGNSNPFLRK